MGASIIAMFATCFDSILDWFDRLMKSTGLWDFFFAMFVLAMAGRFFIKPIVGGAGSDKARARKEDEE